MRYLFAALICAVTSAKAGQVFKCVDAAGKVTFTQGNCPAMHDLDSVVEAKNVAPSGSGPAVTMAQPRQPAASEKSKDGQAYTVVGEVTETPARLIEAPKKSTEPVYRSPQVQPRIVVEERTFVTHGRDKNGNRTAKVEVKKVPVVK